MSDATKSENGTEGNFVGFDTPRQNWFKMPNDWTNLTSNMTLSEMKVIEYVIRHTWGWRGDDDKYKLITTDEFMFGRKKQDGTRLDKGTGLSNHSVYIGLKRAVENGFLVVKVDGKDKGRVKKSYKLNMAARYVNSTDVVRKKNVPYRDKETLEEKHSLSKQKCSDVKCNISGKNNNGFLEKNKNKTPLEKFADKYAKKIKELLKKTEPTSRLSNAKVETFAKDIRKWKVRDNIEKKRIVSVISWYCKLENFSDQFTPKLRKSGDLYHKFGGIEEAKKRQERNEKEKWHDKELEYFDEKSGKWIPRKILEKYRSKYLRKYPGAINERIDQKKLDDILVENGMQPGELSAMAVSVG